MQDIYWDDNAPIGQENKETTWFRVSPQFRDFYKLVKEKDEILGVIIDDKELNIGFIVQPKPITP